MNKRIIVLVAAVFAVACVCSAYAAVIISPSELTVPTEWQKARVLMGGWGDGCEMPSGIATLKCGKANKKGFAKVSLKIKPFEGRTQKYRSTTVYVGGGGSVTVSWGDKYAVTIDPDGTFFGEPIYHGIRPACTPNSVWSADVGGIMSGSYILYFPEWIGQTYWIDGYWDGYGWVDSYWGDFYDVYYATGEVVKGSEYDFLDTIGMLKKYDGGWCVAYDVSSNMDEGMLFTASGSRWSFPTGYEYPTVKLTYKPKTGEFKGSVKIVVAPYCMYYPGRMRSKKKALKVKGYFVDGELYGTAKLKSFTTPVRGW